MWNPISTQPLNDEAVKRLLGGRASLVAPPTSNGVSTAALHPFVEALEPRTDPVCAFQPICMTPGPYYGRSQGINAIISHLQPWRDISPSTSEEFFASRRIAEVLKACMMNAEGSRGLHPWEVVANQFEEADLFAWTKRRARTRRWVRLQNRIADADY